MSRAAHPPVEKWVVIASSNLDSRLKTKITTLAARDGATAQFAKGEDLTHPAKPSSGTLIVQLLESVDGAPWTPEMDREGYQLVATYPADQGPQTIRIRAKTPAGFHHGLLRIRDLLRFQPGDSADLSLSMTPAPQRATVSRSADSVTVSISDFPSFPERGIVEGFYGKPWTHQNRLNMLRFQGEHGMNVYHYGKSVV